MLVCHCRVVNDRRIREEIERGARDEFDIADACGAGTVCGGCLPVVGEILAEYGCAPRCSVATAPHPAARRVARGHAAGDPRVDSIASRP